MITKRGFLTGAASAAAAAATAARGTWAAPAAIAGGSAVGLQQTPSALDSSASSSAKAAFDVVIFNDRYSDARAFAQALAGLGVPALPLAGDAGTLWHGTLDKWTAEGHRRLVGVGTPMDLLILESLGREAGLRLRFRAQHDCRGAKTLTHSISGQNAAAAYALLAQELSAPDWPARLAAALPRVVDRVCARQARCAAAVSAGAASGAVASAGAAGELATSVERSHDHPGMLLSWILSNRVADSSVRQEQS